MDKQERKSKAKADPETFLSVKSISLQNDAPREPMKAQSYESFNRGVDLAIAIIQRRKLMHYAGNGQCNPMGGCPVEHFPCHHVRLVLWV